MSGSPSEDGPIIVIDDDMAIRRACQAALRRVGYEVETFPDGPSGLQRIQETGPALIVVDLKMPGMSGIQVLDRVREINPDIVSIVITGFATVGTAVEAMKAGAYDFIPKPFTAEELRVIIARGMERRRLAMEARRLREEKQAQARKFITFVSHQLQSPLGAVKQYLDVLRHQSGEELPEQARQWIERSAGKITDMLAIIKDWLTISKVEGGQLVTERGPLSWLELVPEVIESFTQAADDAEVTLHHELPSDLPSVIGDVTGLNMLLSNLVANAIKYNQPGGEVRVTAEADEAWVRLSVSDTGPGIAPEKQDRVFEEFYRAVDASTAGKGGTGMGLPICKKIAEELGGEITLASQPAEGAAFTVRLPRATTNGADENAI